MRQLCPRPVDRIQSRKAETDLDHFLRPFKQPRIPGLLVKQHQVFCLFPLTQWTVPWQYVGTLGKAGHGLRASEEISQLARLRRIICFLFSEHRVQQCMRAHVARVVVQNRLQRDV